MTVPKLLGSARLKLRIAFASLAVLASGALVAPRAVPKVLSAPEERAAPLLEEQAQNRSLMLPFAGVTDVLDEVRDTIVTIPPAESAPLPTVSDYAAGARQSSQPAGRRQGFGGQAGDRSGGDGRGCSGRPAYEPGPFRFAVCSIEQD